MNPLSGGRESQSQKKIVASLIHERYYADMVETEYPGHAREIAASAVRDGYDVVVAVGGDGTVNEVASSLVGMETALGIVPVGSGNGLARHLGIPLEPRAAIRRILESEPLMIDVASLNGIPFFCTAGIGFDAQVAADYANSGSRGLATYIKEAVSGFFSYKSEEYVIETERGIQQTEAFMITFANANQWGNDFFIAPEASLQDGKLDVVIVKSVSVRSGWKMVRQLRNRTLCMNPDVMFIKSSYARIKCLSNSTIPVHYDGEVDKLYGDVDLRCETGRLRFV